MGVEPTGPRSETTRDELGGVQEATVPRLDGAEPIAEEAPPLREVHTHSRYDILTEAIERLTAEQETPFTVVDYIQSPEKLSVILQDSEGNKFIGRVMDYPGDLLYAQEIDFDSDLDSFRETHVLKALKHPMIPKAGPLFDLREQRKVLALREYIDGNTLRESLTDQLYFDESAVIEMVRDLAETLRYIHQTRVDYRGKQVIITHGDLKPENIITTDDGYVLTDFDVARVKEDGMTVMHTLDARGTIQYRAPEQQLGDSIPASDLYSLGVIATECLLGNVPNAIRENRLLAKAYSLPRDRELNPRFIGIVEKLIDPVPQRRYQSAAELLADLEELDKPQGTVSSIINAFGGYFRAKPEGEKLKEVAITAAKKAPEDLAEALTAFENHYREMNHPIPRVSVADIVDQYNNNLAKKFYLMAEGTLNEKTLEALARDLRCFPTDHVAGYDVEESLKILLHSANTFLARHRDTVIEGIVAEKDPSKAKDIFLDYMRILRYQERLAELSNEPSSELADIRREVEDQLFDLLSARYGEAQVAILNTLGQEDTSDLLFGQDTARIESALREVTQDDPDKRSTHRLESLLELKENIATEFIKRYEPAAMKTLDERIEKEVKKLTKLVAGRVTKMADKTRNYGEITAIQIVTDDSNELAGVLYHDMREKECYVFAKRDANGGFSLKEFTLTEDEVGFPELHMIAGQPVVVCTTYLDLITSYNAWDKPESNRSARPKVHHYAHKILSPLHLPNGKVISGDGDVSCFLPAHGKTSSYLVITDSVNYNSPFFDVIDLESGEKTRTITARCALPSCQTETGPIQMFLEDGYWVNYNIETGENLGRVDSVNDAFHRMRKQNEVGLPRISCDLVDFLGDPQSPTHALMRYEGTDYVPAADRYDVSYGIPGGGDDFHYLLYDLTKGADEPPKRYIMAHTGSLWEGAPIPDYNETYDQKLPTGHDQIRILKPRLTYFGDEVVVTGMADSVVEMPPVRYRQQRIEPKRKPGYIAWIPDSNSEVQPELGWSDMPPRDYRS